MRRETMTSERQENESRAVPSHGEDDKLSL